MRIEEKPEDKMRLKAILLCDKDLTTEDLRIYKLLDFFGISCQVMAYEEAFSSFRAAGDMSGSNYCVLGAAPLIAKATGFHREPQGQLPPIITGANSVYVYGFEESSLCTQLLRRITGDPNAKITRDNETQTSLNIARDCPEICGPMCGLSIFTRSKNTDVAFRLSRRGEGIKSLISGEKTSFFLMVEVAGVRFFLNACREVINIDAPVERSFFDIKDYVFEAVPPVMYITWAFRDVRWRSRETGACLIIDDPPLTPRYGFFDFKRVLELMNRYGFSMNIAFIPLNWKRSKSAVVKFVKNNPDKYSLSIHGCDHIAGEFGTESDAELNWKTKLAKKRMQLHLNKTGCTHDLIMVFPQGIFSKKSTEYLKHNNFMAAVNTEVAPCKDERLSTIISDVWSLAIMKYESFPIVTRRYPEHGIENFAFDALLGKPCLIVTHHEFFRNNFSYLIHFIEQLKSLNLKLSWHGLGEVISNNYQEKCDIQGNKSVRMFSNRLTIENCGLGPAEYHVVKQENNFNNIKIIVNNEIVNWRHEGNHLDFKVVISSKEKYVIQIIYDDLYGGNEWKANSSYCLKTLIRRRLSEVRDNYVSKSNFLTHQIGKLRRWI